LQAVFVPTRCVLVPLLPRARACAHSLIFQHTGILRCTRRTYTLSLTHTLLFSLSRSRSLSNTHPRTYAYTHTLTQPHANIHASTHSCKCWWDRPSQVTHILNNHSVFFYARNFRFKCVQRRSRTWWVLLVCVSVCVCACVSVWVCKTCIMCT